MLLTNKTRIQLKTEHIKNETRTPFKKVMSNRARAAKKSMEHWHGILAQYNFDRKQYWTAQRIGMPSFDFLLMRYELAKKKWEHFKNMQTNGGME